MKISNSCTTDFKNDYRTAKASADGAAEKEPFTLPDRMDAVTDKAKQPDAKELLELMNENVTKLVQNKNEQKKNNNDWRKMDAEHWQAMIQKVDSYLKATQKELDYTKREQRKADRRGTHESAGTIFTPYTGLTLYDNVTLADIRNAQKERLEQKKH